MSAAAGGRPSLGRLLGRVKFDGYLTLIVLMVVAASLAPARGHAAEAFEWATRIAIGLVFYFLIIRPQGKARKRAAEVLAALKKNDEITTAGGIIGRVKEIRDDRITIESGTSTLVVERSRIIRVGDTATPGLV